MKWPVLQITKETELANLVYWAVSNGYLFGSSDNAGYVYTTLLKRLRNSQHGIDIYFLYPRNVFDSIVHPAGIRHRLMIHVNSFRHLKFYLSKRPPEPSVHSVEKH